MDINETLEADWIQIRAILKAQVKRLAAAPAFALPEVVRNEGLERAKRMIAECEKVISAYAVKV
jgi:hypothetical protein